MLDATGQVEEQTLLDVSSLEATSPEQAESPLGPRNEHFASDNQLSLLNVGHLAILEEQQLKN